MKRLEFVRFGGLSPVNHKKFYKTDSYHSPPRRKGIYAFIFPYIEDFLWCWKLDGDDYIKDRKKYHRTNRRKFKYSGDIWTHGVEEAKKLNCGLDFSKAWVKIHTDNLNNVLTLMKQTDRIQLKDKETIHDPYKRGLGGWISKDHLEVFIERI